MYLEILYIMSVFSLFILTVMTCSQFRVVEEWIVKDQITSLDRLFYVKIYMLSSVVFYVPLIKLLLCSLFCYYACKYIALFYFHKTIYHFFLCFLKKSQKYTLFYYTTPQLHYI